MVLASSVAFSAAMTGQLSAVKKFLDEYPTFKNRSSLWGTTLLYTAALNNQFEIVKYLVEKAHCSVNARNWCNMHIDQSSTSNPTPGSTALHGACSNGHLRIVGYFVKEKNADYFIKNQAKRTPIEYGEQYPDIKQFFQNYLIISYSNSSLTNLPNKPIIEEDRPQQDCIWEYKPLKELEWHKFSVDEGQILQRALISPKNFQINIQLKKNQGLFSVSMTKFLQSDEIDSDSLEKQAWIRCRGSSVLNFDIDAIWQLMFMKHPRTATKSTSLLTVSYLTTDLSNDFDVELNKWYTCDTRINSLLNNSINIRQKVIPSNIYLGMNSESLTFNLHSFTFANGDKTVFGYLRWIPKLISHDERNKNKTWEVDNFQTMNNVEPAAVSIDSGTDEISREKKESTNDDEEDSMGDGDNDNDDDDDSSTITQKVCFYDTTYIENLILL